MPIDPSRDRSLPEIGRLSELTDGERKGWTNETRGRRRTVSARYRDPPGAATKTLSPLSPRVPGQHRARTVAPVPLDNGGRRPGSRRHLTLPFSSDIDVLAGLQFP